jgi:hypothetical protein
MGRGLRICLLLVIPQGSAFAVALVSAIALVSSLPPNPETMSS